MKKLRKLKLATRQARKNAERSKRLVNAQDKLINVERLSWKDAKKFLLTDYLIDKNTGNFRAFRDCKLEDLVDVDLINNLPKPIVVTPRQTGMTSTGQTGDCHANVRELVQKYGGKQITGYELWKYGDSVELNWHSVWQTPENKVVDVTCISDYDQTKQEPRTEEYLFIPLCYTRDNFFVKKPNTKPALLKNKCILKERNRVNEDIVERVVQTFEGKNQISLSFFGNIDFVFDSLLNYCTKKKTDSQFLEVA